MTDAQNQIIGLLKQIRDGGGGGGGVTDVTGTAPIASSGGDTPAISIAAATGSDPGSMSAADKTKLDTLSAHSGGVLGTAQVSTDGLGAQVPTFATGILSVATFNSSASGRIVVTFASAQPDDTYVVNSILWADGFVKLNSKNVNSFELRTNDPALTELNTLVDISISRLSQ